MAEAGDLAGELTRLRERIAQLEALEEKHRQIIAALEAGEKQYRTLQENLPIGVFRSDLEGRVIAANSAMAKMLGYDSAEALLAEAPIEVDFLHSPARQELVRLIDEAGFVTDYETRLITKHKKEFWASLSVRAVKNEAGEVTHYDGTVTDITERKRAQEALHASERKYRLLADNVSDVIWIMDMNLKFTYMSPSVTRMRGYTLEEAMGQTIQEALTPPSAALAMKVMEEELTREAAGGADPRRTRSLLLEHRCKDGQTIWCETKVSFIRDDRGSPVGILGVDRDVTERRLVEERLEQLNRFLNLVIESVNVMLYVLDERGRVVIWNKAAEEISGYSAAEIVGNPAVWEKIYPSAKYRNDLRELAPGLFDGRRPVNGFETIVTSRDGKQHNILWHSRSMWDASRKLHGCVVLGHDVTEQRRAESALRESEEKYRTLVESAEEGICVVGPDGMITFANETAVRALGIVLKDAGAVAVRDVLNPADADAVISAVRAAIGTGRGLTREIKLELADGGRWHRLSVQPIRDASGKPVSALVIAFDLSDRRRVENELLEISAMLHKGIGEDLEAGPCRALEELSRQCEALQQALAQSNLPEAAQAANIASAARRALALARDMANILNPMALNSANLEIALRDLAKTAGELYAIQCAFKCFAATGKLPRPVAANLYQIAEEAIATAARRHNAKQVQLGLFERDGSIFLVARHDVGGQPPPPQPRGALDTIECRARMMGGSVEFKNNEDGTRTLTCKIPLAD